MCEAEGRACVVRECVCVRVGLLMEACVSIPNHVCMFGLVLLS